MDTEGAFYLCSMCFRVACSAREHHGRKMIRCDPGEPGDERRKPLVDTAGQLASRAPLWFLSSLGSLPRETRRGAPHG